VEELCSCPNEGDYICSVAWSADGTHLALGTSDAKVEDKQQHTLLLQKSFFLTE
jgi:hypothetical protein